MQKPQESLDDFLRPIEPIMADPPSTVSLRPTGEFEMLSPLPIDQAPAKTTTGLLLQHAAPRISWFHRSLIFGGAAAGAVAIIFLSAVFIAMSERSDRASVDGVETTNYPSEAPLDDSPAPVEETAAADILTSAIESQVFGELRTMRPGVRTQRSVPQIQRASYVPRRTPRPARLPAFVPTKLVIYVENGEIKNRIEPALSAANTIPTTLSN